MHTRNLRVQSNDASAFGHARSSRWLTFAAAFIVACHFEDGGEATSSSTGDSESVCTAETEAARWRELTSDDERISTPPECMVDLLTGTYQGQIAPWDDFANAPGRSTLWAEFDDGALTKLDGVPCSAIYPGQVQPAHKLITTNESSCYQMFVCDCCIVSIERAPVSTPSGAVENDVWTVESTAGCRIGMKSTDYYFNAGFESVPPSTSTNPSDPTVSACDQCLSGCSGSPSCCTGSGCLCEDACRPSSDCGTGMTYCCGPDGFCFCTDGCPY